ncbi:hypothetical protein BDQ17DRAFT_1351199 [Cyathus striatus]|nr:hypothetical protein BDQ17DRAFT_1351199 [Cyathus striatus]
MIFISCLFIVLMNIWRWGCRVLDGAAHARDQVEGRCSLGYACSSVAKRSLGVARRQFRRRYNYWYFILFQAPLIIVNGRPYKYRI